MIEAGQGGAAQLSYRTLHVAGRTRTPIRSQRIVEALNVTHLECSLTGERYEAGQVHNLSRAGKPLLVRYDIEAAKRTLTRESVAAREPGMWKWREMLPHDGEPVSLGEPETPLVPLPNIGAREGASNLLVKDEGRLPTGSFKARGLAMAVTMAKQFGIERIAMPTNGNAGAALGRLWRAGRDRDGRHLPRRNAGNQRHRNRRLWRSRLCRRRPDRRVWRAGGEGRGAGPVVRLLDAQGALSPRGQEGDGVRACRAARLGPARRDLLPDRAAALV